MKKILISLLLIVSAFGCKKENQNAQISLSGTTWESSSFPNGDVVVLNERLEFISANEVVFYSTFSTNRLMTAQGRATMSFTIDDPNAVSPTIHIKGRYNSISGTIGQGAIADFKLTYNRASGNAEPSLSVGDGKIYAKVVYR
ncbi:hypothetical protein ACXZ1K_16995 [Pedobacter sp. PWIIR3]